VETTCSIDGLLAVYSNLENLVLWASSEMIGSARPNLFMVSGVRFQVSAIDLKPQYRGRPSKGLCFTAIGFNCNPIGVQDSVSADT